MRRLETFGDSFLKAIICVSLYYQWPFDDCGELTQKKESEVSNAHLIQLAKEKKLQHYLYVEKPIYSGEGANWLPPGYTVDENSVERYLTRKVEEKAAADIVESLIGCYFGFDGSFNNNSVHARIRTQGHPTQ